MYTTTRKTPAIFATMIVVTTAITLVTSATAAFTTSVLAAKTGLSHHSHKDSNGLATSGTDKSGDSSNTVGSPTNDSTPPAKSDSENLKSLFACESAAANGSGKLTKTDVINCYSQTFSDNSASSGNSNNSEGDSANGSSSDSGSSSSSHTHHHHTASSTSDSTTGSSEGP